MPDRGRDRRSLGPGPGHRPGRRGGSSWATSSRARRRWAAGSRPETATASMVGSVVQTAAYRRSGCPAFMTSANAGSSRIGSRLGIVVHPAEVGVAALDQVLEQADGAGRQGTALVRVLPGDGPGGEGEGAGGVVTQVGVLGLVLERRSPAPRSALSAPSPSSAATTAARASLARSGSSRFRNLASSARASSFLPSRARAMTRSRRTSTASGSFLIRASKSSSASASRRAGSGPWPGGGGPRRRRAWP